MIVGFTGTRQGMTDKAQNSFRIVMRGMDINAFHHGDCIGADQQAHMDVYLGRNFRPEPLIIHKWPPINQRHCAYCPVDEQDVIHPTMEYLVRNRRIVNACDVLIVAPQGYVEQLRSGTWTTYRYAKKAGKSIVIVYPNGQLGQKQRGR